MRRLPTSDLRGVIDEHNVLNGLRFVTVEFAAVAGAAAVLGSAGVIDGDIGLAGFGFGLTVNALTLTAISARQLRRGLVSYGLLRFRSARFRRWVADNHSGLGRRTTWLAGLMLVPCSIPLTLAVQSRSRVPRWMPPAIDQAPR